VQSVHTCRRYTQHVAWRRFSVVISLAGCVAIAQFIDKFRYNAKRASLVQSRIKALNRMEELADVMEDPSWQFSFPEPDLVSGALIQVRL